MTLKTAGEISSCPLGKTRTDEPCCSYNPGENQGVGRTTSLIGWTWVVSLYENNISFCSLWCAERFLNVRNREIVSEKMDSKKKKVFVQSRIKSNRRI